MRAFASLLISAILALVAVEDVVAKAPSAFSKRHGGGIAHKRAGDLLPAVNRRQARTCNRSHRPASSSSSSAAANTVIALQAATSSVKPKTSSTKQKAATSPAPAPTTSSTKPAPTTSAKQAPAPATTSTKPKTTSPPKNVAPSSTASYYTSASGNSNSGASSSTSSSDEQAYLDGHNTVRAQHGAVALTWDDTLAAAAQKWANNCQFVHSGGSLGPYGENLAAGTGDFTIAQALNAWASEPYTGQPSHFTQMVWKATTKVGCAVQTCTGIFGSTPAKFYVCEYSPQGNVIGEFDQNVQA